MDFQGIQELLWEFKTKFSASGAELIGYSMLIGSIGALIYIAIRVWGHIARGESIDVYPLLRPFGIGLIIIFFPSFVALIDGVFQPLGDVTDQMAGVVSEKLEDRYDERNRLIDEKNSKKAPPEAESDKEESAGWFESFVSDKVASISNFFSSFSMDRLRSQLEEWFMQILRWIYRAASLIIEVLSVFTLLILTIFGPLAFGLSIYDGLSNNMVSWLARYINVSLWVPVANVLRALMGQLELFVVEKSIAGLQGAEGMGFSENVGLIIFYIMGIVCFFMIPTITGWIVSGGGNTAAIGGRAMGAATGAAGAAGAAVGMSMGVSSTQALKKISSEGGGGNKLDGSTPRQG